VIHPNEIKTLPPGNAVLIAKARGGRARVVRVTAPERGGHAVLRRGAAPERKPPDRTL
jgi:hypothetical protein